MRAEIRRIVPWADGQWPPTTDSLAVTLDDEDWAFIRGRLARIAAVRIQYGLERSGEELEEVLRVQLDGT